MSTSEREGGKALEHIRNLCLYAYQHGYHELEYDPVETLTATIAELRAQVEGLRERVKVNGIGRPTKSANEIADDAIRADVANMLEELGNPPLVQTIYANGWQRATSDQLRVFHELCIRSIKARGKST